MDIHRAQQEKPVRLLSGSGLTFLYLSDTTLKTPLWKAWKMALSRSKSPGLIWPSPTITVGGITSHSPGPDRFVTLIALESKGKPDPGLCSQAKEETTRAEV